MNRGQALPATSRSVATQAVLLVAGLSYVGTGIALLLAPRWFFENVGNFPPFNRHYAGDLGTFLLPLGLALLVAARNPSRHLLLIGMAAGASLLHAFNHLYDAVAGQATLIHGLIDIGPLLGLGTLLSIVYVGLRVRPS